MTTIELLFLQYNVPLSNLRKNAKGRKERKEKTKDEAVAFWWRRSASTGSRWTKLLLLPIVGMSARWGYVRVGECTKRRRVELPLANVSCQSSRVSRRGSVVSWLCVSRLSSNTDDACLPWLWMMWIQWNQV